MRQTVLELRKALDDEVASILSSEDDRLVLGTEAVRVDVRAFERLAAENMREAVEHAVEIYRGDLLEGLNVRSEGFDEWLLGERARLHDLAVGVLERLVSYQAEAGESETAIETARRLLALDPVREEAHRMLMRLYYSAGHRSAALKQYQVCKEALRRELDVEPEPETAHLYSEIRTSQTEAGGPLDAAGTAPTTEPVSRTKSDVVARPARAVGAAPNARTDTTEAKPARRRRWQWAGLAAVAVVIIGGWRSGTSSCAHPH